MYSPLAPRGATMRRGGGGGGCRRRYSPQHVGNAAHNGISKLHLAKSNSHAATNALLRVDNEPVLAHFRNHIDRKAHARSCEYDDTRSTACACHRRSAVDRTTYPDSNGTDCLLSGSCDRFEKGPARPLSQTAAPSAPTERCAKHRRLRTVSKQGTRRGANLHGARLAAAEAAVADVARTEL